MKTRKKALPPCKPISSTAVTVLILLMSTFYAQQANAYDKENHAPWIERISIGKDGIGANDYSSGPAISADGKKAFFFSKASNLVDPDDNFGIKDVFVRDLETNTTSLVSISSTGLQCRCQGRFASPSANGRFVAFNLLDEQGPGLVPEDDNDKADVYVRDMFTGETKLASVALNGRAGNDYSSGLGPSTPEAPSISPDGRFVAFSSAASNLVAGDTNGVRDVFVRDLLNNKTERLSIGIGGAEANGASTATGTSAISNSGKVVFYSDATNLVNADPDGARTDLFLYDSATQTTTLLDWQYADFRYGLQAASLSADGRYLAFRSFDNTLVPDDTNRVPDIFVRDLTDGSVTRVNVDSQGGQSECPCGFDYRVSISKNGRYVTFYSENTDLVPDDTNSVVDVFRHDLQTGQTLRVSKNISGEEANHDSGRYGWPAVSDDGRTAFDSDANNLVEGDEDFGTDVFAHE